ncbi:AfsR/SARP family transcriptional regulator [Nocardioides speluncae]|uniref:AfsR/SARP family transcriptional regulator n=1 Tax=Nocardioides speluncae TaxID=2670337 RepID=UPI00137B7C81|nr:BTAD domain-containing putative transcriptional regulator [Nocardioides speluncae]
MVKVQLLGPVRAWQEDDEIALGSVQQRTVFAILAASAGRPIARAELIDALWPAGPPPSATNVVQTYIKRLRRALEPGRPARAPSAVLPGVADGYCLRADAVDLVEFRDLVRDARRSASPTRRARLLAAGVRLWEGDPLAATQLAGGPLAQGLQGELDQAGCWYAESALMAGLAADAVPLLERAVRTQPLHEGLHAALMRLYQAVGRRSAAFDLFLRVRTRLVDDLGIDPGPELAAAHAALLADVPLAPARVRIHVRPRRVQSTWPHCRRPAH